MYDYDITVIGAGAAGLVACKLANGLGKKTLLIEKEEIGGDCTLFGCVPSKTLIKSAYIAHQTTRLAQFGLTSSEPVEINTQNVMTHVRSIIRSVADSHPAQSLEALGINVTFGEPIFIDNHKIELNQQTISSDKFIICTGSAPSVPPIEGLENIPYLTNKNIFDLKTLPESMLVLGAGPISIELSAALNRLGVNVTILQRSEKILKKEDSELTDRLIQTLRDEGLNIMTNTKIRKFTNDKNAIVAHLENSNDTFHAESLLIATGRVPNLDHLKLKNAGVEYDMRGVRVDKHLRTTAKNIFAAGDIVPPYLFSHIAEYEAIIAATNASFPIPIKKTNYDNILWATYTDPELAHAGLTEEQARQKYGDNIRIYRWEHKNIDRAKTDLATNGLSKFICDKHGKLLGIHILGHAAAELMHEAQLAKSLGTPFRKIASVIHAYPSYSDAVRQPAKKCYIENLENNPILKTIKKLQKKLQK